MPQETTSTALKLPTPDKNAPLEKLLFLRKSQRDYKSRPVTLEQLSALCWSAQGALPGGLRVVPSAGATYPLDLLVVLNQPCAALQPGIYAYLTARHELQLEQAGKFTKKIVEACWNQMFMAQAPLLLVITCAPERITPRYGERSRRYIDMEAGHAGQNVALMAAQLGLGTVMVGAFDDAALAKVFALPKGQQVVYLFPIGEPA
ncbi:MAG TPA: SagB/ThcOx family dehydrogenase [Planctomycetota bacterium]|jgi:SagB-type dehydrogenase family enzyme